MSESEKRKRLTERPTAEVVGEIFPPEVIALAQQVAHEKDPPVSEVGLPAPLPEAPPPLPPA